MQAGVSTASLFMRENNEDALPILDKFGVKTAEVFLTSYSEYDGNFGKLLAERKGNISVHSVHVLNTQIEPQLTSGNPRTKRDSFSLLGKAMEAGKALGAGYYTFHGVARCKKSSRENKEDLYKVGQGLEEIRTFCEKYGLKLCLENVEWSTYNRVGVFSKVKEVSPSLLGVLDIKQARISGYPYEDYLNEMGQSIAHVHVSDFDGNGKVLLPGKGNFDFPTLVRRLKDVGFSGPLFIEVYKDSFSDVSEIKESVEFLSEILYRENAL